MSGLPTWTESKNRRLAKLKSDIKRGDVTETDFEDVIICPYCGENDSDDRYDGEGTHTYCCGHCGKEYECNVSISISYATSRKSEVQS